MFLPHPLSGLNWLQCLLLCLCNVNNLSLVGGKCTQWPVQLCIMGCTCSQNHFPSELYVPRNLHLTHNFIMYKRLQTRLKTLRSQGHNQPPPVALAFHHQSSWDSCKMQATLDALLEDVPDARSRAPLLDAASKESGAWLTVLPISSFSLHMEDDSICIAVGLRFGTTLCSPHNCCHCGEGVDHLGIHG